MIVVGHRGASGHAPENTVASMRKAAELGASWVELDVHRTRDRVLVCHHDACLAGDDRLRIAGLTFAEACAAAPQLASVEAILGEVAALGLGANVELKETGYEDEVVELARGLLPRERLLFTSFEDDAVRRVREIGLSLRTGLLVWSRNARDLVPWRRLAALHADVLVIPERFRRWGVAKGAHERGYPVYVYTVNETAALERWTRTPGVEGVITDYPDRLAAVLAEAER